MKMRDIKRLVEDRKEEKNEVAEVLAGVRKIHGDTELINALPLRLDEVDSFLQVIHAALESNDHDESFFRDHVGKIMWLLEERFDELHVMVDELLEREWASRKQPEKSAA